MAEAAGAPMPAILEGYLRRGSPAFGEVEPSGLFQEKEVKAELTVKELLKTAKWARARI